jgi:alpha-galactosidase
VAAHFDIAAHAGGIDLTVPALPHVWMRGLRPEVVYWQGEEWHNWRPAVQPVAGGFEATAPERGLQVCLRTEWHDAGFLVCATLRNSGTQTIRLARLAPLVLDTGGACAIGDGAQRWSVYRQGYQSWTGTRSFRAGEADRDPCSMLLKIGLIDICRPSPELPGHFRSDMCTAIKHLKSGEVVVIGFLTGGSAFGSIEVHIDGQRCARLAAVLEYDGIPLEPAGEIAAPPLWIAADGPGARRGQPENDLLAQYAGAVGAAMRARVPARNPVGWCSWYYYFTRISEDEMLKNLGALTRLRARFGYDYVQVDDGYQSEIGDWLSPNAKFPHGMQWLAQQIRDAGFDAGIWTAPFIARRGATLLREHPDWFVRNRRGRPRFALYNPVWGKWGACYALDTTHPQALEWLRQTYRTIVHEWGYRVLKLDFLFAAALPGERHDPSATRAAALRCGLEAIREGAGDDAFLLGCGCPLGPAIGVVDAMRIGPDVSPYWANAFSRGPQRDLHGLATKHAIRNTLTRAFLHGRWWCNDPDCLMIRDTETELTEDEVRTLATAIALTDGMIVLSDRMEQLSEARLALLDRTLAVGSGSAEVVDLMDADMPELLVHRSPDRTLVAVFNFDDAPQAKEVDFTSLGVRPDGMGQAIEWWTGAPVPIRDGRADLGILPVHGCRVVEIR